MLKIIGLLDDNFFAYWEENDLCWRGKIKGYKSYYEPSSVIWHKESASVQSDIKIYLLARNRLLFMRKHASGFQKSLFISYFLLYHFWSIMIALILETGNLKKTVPFIKGIMDGLFNNPVKGI